MQAAEEDLAKIAAKPASEDQVEALKSLIQSHEALPGAVEGLLVELRSELQSRIISELVEMHEIQADIRETTQAQAPRVEKRSRTALVQVVGLSRKESELGDRAERLRALVVETEYGIALPTARRAGGRDEEDPGMAGPGRCLATHHRPGETRGAGLARPPRSHPAASPHDSAPCRHPLPTDPSAQERELNRLIAELKMIRLLQVRLNDDTIDADHAHPGTAALTPALKREIETLKASQEEIRDSITRLSERFEPPADNGNGG